MTVSDVTNTEYDLNPLPSELLVKCNLLYYNKPNDFFYFRNSFTGLTVSRLLDSCRGCLHSRVRLCFFSYLVSRMGRRSPDVRPLLQRNSRLKRKLPSSPFFSHSFLSGCVPYFWYRVPRRSSPSPRLWTLKDYDDKKNKLSFQNFIFPGCTNRSPWLLMVLFSGTFGRYSSLSGVPRSDETPSPGPWVDMSTPQGTVHDYTCVRLVVSRVVWWSRSRQRVSRPLPL